MSSKFLEHRRHAAVFVEDIDSFDWERSMKTSNDGSKFINVVVRDFGWKQAFQG
jgi:hypothetical protein